MTIFIIAFVVFLVIGVPISRPGTTPPMNRRSTCTLATLP